jgi:hypothetical protein
MIFLPSPPPEQIAAEAREALRRHPPLTGRALFLDLIRCGFINAQGEVTRLIGGEAEPEPNYQKFSEDKLERKEKPKRNGKPKRKKAK